jgi:hypothetical protein
MPSFLVATRKKILLVGPMRIVEPGESRRVLSPWPGW